MQLVVGTGLFRDCEVRERVLVVWRGAEGDDVGCARCIEDVLEDLEAEAFGPAAGVDNERGVGELGVVGFEEIGDTGDVVGGIGAGGGVANVVGAGCGEGGGDKRGAEDGRSEDVEREETGWREGWLAGVNVEICDGFVGREESVCEDAG